MTKYMVANWKMNGSLDMAHGFCHQLIKQLRLQPTHNTLVICPPSPYLSFVNGAVSGTQISIGAQDCSNAEKGAFTGETSAPMLADIGCSYVLIGHSERRQNHTESNDLLTEKLQRALDADLIPIFCIGENQQDLENNHTQQVLQDQLKALTPFQGQKKIIIIAYEPVWAIGTGKVPSLEIIEKTCSFIAKDLLTSYELTSPILYGGSVSPSNASEILALPSVGGVLIGGASLNPHDFLTIASTG